MNHLYYRTRGNSAPHGKPRVYFACHPADFERCFNSTVELLQRYNNCAVWYEDAADLLPDEELRSQLEEMQLVVIPVTTRLLTRSNRATDLVYPFALERHIPVLPLMMETGLDELFTRKFGDLQYLQPENTDPTALPFEKKLESYLSGVLVGEELAQQVRDAFDAYIFLSYRKKGRKYAQELMRLIHQNERFRDIAIWYDEYLVPGESFNDAIRKALEKSELFTLVVTPNLLERGNYVMTEEYPKAQKSEKPILPVEMAETNKAKLEQCFQQIPRTVSPQKGNELDETMLEHLHRIALSENDSNPQHNFLIGLAYLDGIDVEVDNHRAVNLITGAAETGHEAAMRKLVSMYETGKGVERDYYAAVEWQEKLVALLRERYRKSGSEEDYRGLFSALWTLGNSYFTIRHIHSLESAKKQYEEMLHLSKNAPENRKDRDSSVSCQMMGDYLISMGNLNEAKQMLLCALRSQEIQVKGSNLTDDYRDLCGLYQLLGDIEIELGNRFLAGKWYKNMYRQCRDLADKTGTVLDWRNLSVCYERLGQYEAKYGTYPCAKKWFLNGIKLSSELVEEEGTEESRLDLSHSYRWLGWLESLRSGKYNEVKKWINLARELCEEVERETACLECWQLLATVYSNLGLNELCTFNFKDAKDWVEKSYKLRMVLRNISYR